MHLVALLIVLAGVARSLAGNPYRRRFPRAAGPSSDQPGDVGPELSRI